MANQDQDRNEHIGEMAGLGAGMMVGARVGTLAIPIPVVGTFVGAMVGGVLGSAVGQRVGAAALSGFNAFMETLSNPKPTDQAAQADTGSATTDSTTEGTAE